MKKLVVTSFACLFIQMAFSGIATAAEPTPAATTVSKEKFDYLPHINKDWGKILLNMRLRYEKVNQDPVPPASLDNADAVTFRTRLGYQTPTFFGFTGLVEGEFTAPFNMGTYKSPGVTSNNRAVIVDPRNHELNRAQLSYTGLSDTTMILGRQRIQIDNQRFIGSVPWRQNKQTFDAFTLQNNSIKGLEFYYGYLDRANRIFGKESHPKEHPGWGYYWEMESHIVNIAYKPCPYAKIGGYAYLLKIKSSPTNARDTYGAYLSGKYPIGILKLNYHAEYATQDENSESPSGTSIDLDYYHFKLGAACDKTKLNFGVGYEVLEGDGVNGFQTPLGTNHAFNGWADKFLSTPDDGLEDLYAWAGIKLPRNIMLKVVYHDFEAENGGRDYGDELDGLAVWKIDKHFKALFKYANYNEGDFAAKTNTEKYTLEMNFSY